MASQLCSTFPNHEIIVAVFLVYTRPLGNVFSEANPYNSCVTKRTSLHINGLLVNTRELDVRGPVIVPEQARINIPQRKYQSTDTNLSNRAIQRWFM